MGCIWKAAHVWGAVSKVLISRIQILFRGHGESPRLSEPGTGVPRRELCFRELKL